MAVTLAAGDVLTAARFNALAPLYLAQGSDQSLTTSAADWNVGAISLDAGTTWVVEMLFDIGNASVAGNDFRPTYVVTGGTTQGRAFIMGAKSGNTTNGTGITDMALCTRANNVTNSYGMTSDTALRNMVRIVTVLTSTTAGTFKVQVATSSGTATLYTGSILIAHRVS